jgi:antirestriction protein ArdC
MGVFRKTFRKDIRMNRTSTTARTESRDGRSNRAPRDHYQEVTDRIIPALEAGTPPWRRPWEPDKAGGPAMPRNAATGQRYRGINVLTLGAKGDRSDSRQVGGSTEESD